MRKLHDRFFKQAKREGHLARSIYKLEELDRRNRIFKKGQHVLDLGASPGSWLEYILETIGEDGKACAVDLKPIAKQFKGKAFFLKKDVREIVPEDFADVTKAFDVIVSDMAPNTSGVKIVNQARSLELCEVAADIARRMLKKGGHFVCKVLESPEVHDFCFSLQPEYSVVKLQKPKASREESTETYVLCLGKGLPKPVKQTPDPTQKKTKAKTKKKKGKRTRQY